MFEDEEIGQAVARDADEALVVILDSALHLFAIHHLHPHRRPVLDEFLEVLDLFESLLRRARGFSLLSRTRTSYFFFGGGCGFCWRSGETLM